AGGKDGLHRGWNTNLLKRLSELHSPVAHQPALPEEGLDHLLHEEGIALGALDDESLEGCKFTAIPKQRCKHFVGCLTPQSVEPYLRVVGLVAPLMVVLRAIIDQQ